MYQPPRLFAATYPPKLNTTLRGGYIMHDNVILTRIFVAEEYHKCLSNKVLC